MSNNVFFISDLHLGHRRILDFSAQWRGGNDTHSHDNWIVDQWNSRVNKRDVVYVLGDIAFTRDGLARFSEMRGHKKLILGNHDKFHITEYSEYFTILPSIFKYKEFWLSHAPIHPDELRGKLNIHGHVHSQSIDDPRYINICVEPLRGVPISLNEIRSLNN